MSDQVDRLKAEIRRLRKTVDALSPSLDHLLARRGFKIYKKERSDDLLVPRIAYAETFYEQLKRYSFRLFLRDIIKHQVAFSREDVARYSTEEVTSDYIDFLLDAGIVECSGQNTYRLRKIPVRSFGTTLEWFVAKLIRDDFGIQTVWGVKFRRARVGGDYDIIGKIDSGLLYMEVKSSPPKQIYDREISSFLNRAEDLAPMISLFFVDTELRMKDKIVPMFEEALFLRHQRIIPITRLVKELFQIGKKIYIINAKGGISTNIEKVLIHKFTAGSDSDSGRGDMSSIDICAVCAWRADCRKKFSISGRDIHCPDFSRDWSTPKGEDETESEGHAEDT